MILKRAGVAFMLFTLLILAGCKNNTSQGNQVSNVAAGEEYIYTKTVREVEFESHNDILPFSYTFSDDYLYFCQEDYDVDENESEESYIIKRISIEKYNEETILSLKQRPFCFSVKAEDGCDVICMIYEMDDGYVIKEYNAETKDETEISLNEKVGKKRPTMILKSSDGYVISFDDKVSFFDPEGKTVSSFTCQGSGLNQLTAVDDKVVYATYRNGNKMYIGKIVKGSGKVTDEIEIPSTTKNIFCDSGLIFATDGKEILAYNFEAGECFRVMGLVSYDLSLSDVNCFAGTKDEIRIFSKNPFMEDSKAKIIQLTKTDQLIADREKDVDPLGRKIIRLYSSSEEARKIAIPDELLLKFNESNKPIASVCVAALALGHAGILFGKKATTYHHGDGRRQKQLEETGAEVVNEPVVITENIITSYCPQTAPEVAFSLLEMLVGTRDMLIVKKAMGF